MPKVILKNSTAKNSQKIKSMDIGELAIITEVDNPGLIFKDKDKNLVFIGANSSGSGSGSSTGGTGNVDLTDYQKKVITEAINGNDTIEEILKDLDKRLNTKPKYTSAEIRGMGGFGSLAYRDCVDLGDLCDDVSTVTLADGTIEDTSMKQRYLDTERLARKALQPSQLTEILKNYQTKEMTTPLSTFTNTTVEGTIAELNEKKANAGCECGSESWSTDKDSTTIFTFDDKTENTTVSNNITTKG